jgi:hypothetical protein
MRIVGQNGMHFRRDPSRIRGPDPIGSRAWRSPGSGNKLYVLARNRHHRREIPCRGDHPGHRFREGRHTPPPSEGIEVSLQNAKKMTDKLFIPEQYQMMWDFYCRKLERKMSK